MHASRLIELFLKRVRRSEDALDLTKTGIMDWLDLGVRAVAECCAREQLNFLVRETTIMTVAGQAAYALPANAQSVRKAEVGIVGGADRARIGRGVYSDAHLYNSSVRQLNGRSFELTMMDDQVVLIPTPQQSGDTIHIHYYAYPPPLFRGTPSTAAGTSLVLPAAGANSGRYRAPAADWYAGQRLFISAGAGIYQTLTVESAEFGAGGVLELTLESAPGTALNTSTTVVDVVVNLPDRAENWIVFQAAMEWALSNKDQDAAQAYLARAAGEQSPVDGFVSWARERHANQPMRKRVVW